MEDFWLHTEYFYSSFHSSSLLSGAAQVSVGGVWGVRWWDFTVSRPRARRTSSGLRGCMWFDFCCSNELHGYRPDTNGCGLFKLSSLKSHANASGALNMWWAFFSCQRWVFFLVFFFFLHLFVGQRFRVTRRITRLTPFFEDVDVTEAENHHANPVIWPQLRGSGPQLSAYSPFMDICFTSCATGQMLPSSAAPPANILCIWTVNCGPPPL